MTAVCGRSTGIFYRSLLTGFLGAPLSLEVGDGLNLAIECCQMIDPVICVRIYGYELVARPLGSECDAYRSRACSVRVQRLVEWDLSLFGRRDDGRQQDGSRRDLDATRARDCLLMN